jgi:hypothetical protein
MLASRYAFAGRIACVTTASLAVIREGIRAGRDDDATAGAALRFVEVSAVVRR